MDEKDKELRKPGIENGGVWLQAISFIGLWLESMDSLYAPSSSPLNFPIFQKRW